ncbi:hypothetical protein IFM89_019723 [Coptis chinensis]|uniref:Uncharacterized protein n=1 Tax=Coptis chinensis TaxID=261450 RepID=A0A835H4B0_9MAGN|nr:hypothetical protein IFM89_019723 [Coptis chinensis]
MIRDNSSIMKLREIMRLIHREYHLDISYYYAYTGRELVLKDIYGEGSLSYYQLHWFEGALKASNPGSHIVLEIDFISFAGCLSVLKRVSMGRHEWNSGHNIIDISKIYSCNRMRLKKRFGTRKFPLFEATVGSMLRDAGTGKDAGTSLAVGDGSLTDATFFVVLPQPNQHDLLLGWLFGNIIKAFQFHKSMERLMRWRKKTGSKNRKRVVISNEVEFEVENEDVIVHHVNIGRRPCSCRY